MLSSRRFRSLSTPRIFAFPFSHGDTAAYAYEAIPTTGWGPAPNISEIDRTGYCGASELYGYCLNAVDFEYFRTNLFLSPSEVGEEVLIYVGAVDDGSEIKVNGVVAGHAFLSGTTQVINITDKVGCGINEILITLMDDCWCDIYLMDVRISVDGVTVPVGEIDETDTDGDGILDVCDYCAETAIPEDVPTISLGVNRFALVDGDGIFDTMPPKGGGKGPQKSYTINDTQGCSCSQIIDLLDLGEGHKKFGCSISAMDDFISYLEPTGCTTNDDCSSGEYCAKAAGDCDGNGICEPRPKLCLDVWIPVCGCDGNTYSNDCYAAASGVNVNYSGECT